MANEKCMWKTVAEYIVSSENNDRFWQVLNIWWEKPHVVNKRVCGSILHVPLNSEVSFVETMCETLPCKLSHFSGLTTQFRKLLPKNPKKYNSSYESMVNIGDNQALFVVLPTEDLHLPSVQGTSTYYISLLPSDRSTSIHGELLFRLAAFMPSVVDDEVNLLPCVKWLCDALMPRLYRWLTVSDRKCVLRNSLKLVNVEAYNAEYNLLKKKYAKHLVEIWPECTDPQKFVFEDIAIASYLLVLWKAQRQPMEPLQSFVDLGCGNGLLVYLLTAEGHPGYGYDVRRRKIWNLYDPPVRLEECALIPNGEQLFPDVDWIIGNHSDELTPWIPVMAAKSSLSCQFFVLPCCSWDFFGKYQRVHPTLSTYRCYLEYVQHVGRSCGFTVHEDVLRIPSTKRTCFVGQRAGDAPGGVEINVAHISATFHGHDVSNKMDLDESHQCVVRSSTVPVRNCTQLPRDCVASIVHRIAGKLLETKSYVDLYSVEGQVRGRWNRGGQLSLPNCMTLLDGDQRKVLKDQCGGLQTLIRNHGYVFQMDCSTMVSLSDWTARSAEQSPPPNKTRKSKPCWFHAYHPDGCPLSALACMYAHDQQ